MSLHHIESCVTYKESYTPVNFDTHISHALGVHERGVTIVCDDDVSPPRKRGPEPDRLKIDIPFEEGLKRALEKKRPARGWPEHDESGEETEGDDGD